MMLCPVMHEKIIVMKSVCVVRVSWYRPAGWKINAAHDIEAALNHIKTHTVICYLRTDRH